MNKLPSPWNELPVGAIFLNEWQKSEWMGIKLFENSICWIDFNRKNTIKFVDENEFGKKLESDFLNLSDDKLIDYIIPGQEYYSKSCSCNEYAKMLGLKGGCK